MIHVRELIERKTGEHTGDVQTIERSASVLDAARLMNRHKIGALVVTDHGAVKGILTERDVMTRVVAEAKAPAHTTVESVMTSPVLTCEPASKLGEVRKVMRERRIRHLPVADAGRLVGMISIGDLNMADQETLVETIKTMEVYISGGQL